MSPEVLDFNKWLDDVQQLGNRYSNTSLETDVSNSRILNNNSYHDITFRYLLQSEIKSALNGMVPISNEETRGQIMGTLFSYQRFNIVRQDSEIAVLTPS